MYEITAKKALVSFHRVENLQDLEALISERGRITSIHFQSELTGKIPVWEVDGDGGATGSFSNNSRNAKFIRGEVFRRMGHALEKYC